MGLLLEHSLLLLYMRMAIQVGRVSQVILAFLVIVDSQESVDILVGQE